MKQEQQVQSQLKGETPRKELNRLRQELELDLDLNTKLDILDRILQLEEELGIKKVKPDFSQAECFGCGS